MPRPSRFRRRLKWTGVAVCVALLAAWVGNRWYVVDLVFPSSPRRVQLGVREGAFGVTCRTTRFGDVSSLVRFEITRGRKSAYFWLPQAAFGIFRMSCIIPLWIPFLLTAIPTAFLFWRDRKQYP